ncbi:MAG: tetratricopeptide repeat protein [Lacunisphaera sp.]|nr:tetratricopeptide repeat protein [Lacunisphaera sp.]
MPPPRAPSETSAIDQGSPGAPWWRGLLAAAVLVLATGAVYWNSLGTPFQFDDEPAIVYNPTIRTLWPPWGALQPPAIGSGVTGRPLVNLSLAVNYALGGLDVRGYHAMNLALHALAVLTLWGVLRRTLRLNVGRGLSPTFPNLSGVKPDLHDTTESIALAVALLWAVHPLLTESVVCTVQRNEVMGGLFFLLTLYGFVRSVAEKGDVGRDRLIPPSDAPRRDQRSRPTIIAWQAFAVVSCLLGMASKEIVAAAPLLVLLYDRTFVAGTFAAAWRQRRGFYLSLAATWLLLAWLMLGNNQRGGSVGFGLGMSSWDYLLTQCRALTTYLKLSVWPHPLVVDYGSGVSGLGEVWWRGLIVVALLGATVWALGRKPVWGFVGAWFFVILAPSSSFVPLTTQTIAEHRMYLPLIAVLVLAVAALHRLAGRRTLLLGACLAAGLGAATVGRNQVYRSEMTLWTGTVAQAPGNPRAHLNLGQVLFKAGRLEEATKHFETSLRLKPDYAEAHYNLGLAQSRLGRTPEAIGQFEAVLRLVPDHAAAHSDLGIALAQTGRLTEAEAHFVTALRHRPDFAGAHYNFANLLLRTRRPAEAVPHYEAAIGLQADVAEYHSNLAVALMQTGRRAEATARYEAAVQLAPEAPELRLHLALTLAAAGRLREAIPHVEAAVRLRPDFEAARRYLAEMQADLKRLEAAKP